MTNDSALPVPTAGPLMARPSTALFGGAHSARETIAEATEIAKVLAETLEGCPDMISTIEFRERGERVEKQHVNFEGWTMLGVLLGAINGASVHADVEWTRRIPAAQNQPPGWEARAVARMSDGTYLSSAEMMCTRDETRWSNRDDFQVRSMAQTRAQAKALRQVLGWIMALAGYATTPAEEMEALNAESRRAARAGGAAPPSQFRNVGQLMTWAMQYGDQVGYPLDSRAVCRILGIEHPRDIRDLPGAATAIVDAVQATFAGPSADDESNDDQPDGDLDERIGGLDEERRAQFDELVDNGMPPRDAIEVVDGDGDEADGPQGTGEAPGGADRPAPGGVGAGQASGTGVAERPE